MVSSVTIDNRLMISLKEQFQVEIDGNDQNISSAKLFEEQVLVENHGEDMEFSTLRGDKKITSILNQLDRCANQVAALYFNIRFSKDGYLRKKFEERELMYRGVRELRLKYTPYNALPYLPCEEREGISKEECASWYASQFRDMKKEVFGQLIQNYSKTRNFQGIEEKAHQISLLVLSSYLLSSFNGLVSLLRVSK